MSKFSDKNEFIYEDIDSESMTQNHIPNFLGSNRNLRLLQSCVLGATRVRVLGSISGKVVGSNPYSDITDMNSAAVHGGFVKKGQYGNLLVYNRGNFQPGLSTNVGTCANGVCSQTWSSGGCKLEITNGAGDYVPYCDTFEGGYCASCVSGYTLQGPYQCVKNQLVDPNCEQYQGFNTFSDDRCCSKCSIGSLTTVYSPSYGYYYQLCLTSNSLIRDCLTHQYSGYVLVGCFTCSSATNITSYSITVNSQTYKRCLNSYTEYLQNCAAYDYSTSIYTCNSCSAGFQLKNVTVTDVTKLRCLSTATYIVSYCSSYTINSSGSVVCAACQAGSQPKTISGVLKCLPDIVIDPLCTTYILSGSKYECSQCDSAAYLPTSVYTSTGTYKYCLATSTQLIRDCSVYQLVSGKYECYQCSTASNIGKYSVFVNGVQLNRCLNTVTEYTSFCQSYQYSNSVYSCLGCIIGYKSQQKTTTSITCVQMTPGEKISNCLEVKTDDTMKCSKCKTGWTVNSDGTACLNLTPGEVINHCTALNPADLSKCSTCQTGFIVNTQQTACIFNTLENCQTSTTSSGLVQCSVCKSGFRLTHVEIDGSIQTKCISYTKNVQHCSTYELVSGQYPCKTCNANYFLTSIEIDAKSIQKCGLLSQKVEHCAKYSELTGTCVVRCTQCEQGFRLADLFSGLRISKVCLRESTEFIPDCLHYVSSNGQYFCKVGHCQSPAVSISIGTTAIERACTSFNLISQGVIGECLYYQRPLLTSTELRCQKCRSDAVQAPYCI